MNITSWDVIQNTDPGTNHFSQAMTPHIALQAIASSHRTISEPD